MSDTDQSSALLSLGAGKSAPEQAPADLSKFLQDFISGREPQTTQWIRLASLVASQSFSCDVVIRVLQPQEKSASGTLPLDKLGTSIARKIGAKYTPGRLKRAAGDLDEFLPEADDPSRSRDSYTFDRSFLPAGARVLVIGDLQTPAPTFDAIRQAIQNELPNAEVKSFTLQWLREHFQDVQLDGEYFLSSASPLSVLSREANPHHAPKAEELPEPAPQEAPPTQVPEAAPLPEEEAQVAQAPKTEANLPAVRVLKAPADRQRPPARKPKEKERAASLGKVAVIIMAVIVLAGGIVVLGSADGILFKKSALPEVSYVPEPALQLSTEPSEVKTPEVQRPAPVKPKGPVGVVTVPRAGLRSAPALEAKALRKTVKARERVTILKRRPSRVGPDWVQIQTETGAVGWVWASVIREVRSR